jgi:hypothetical protein
MCPGQPARQAGVTQSERTGDMTQTISSTETANTDRIRSLRWGAPAVVAAAALSVFSVYGDGTLSASQQASQEAALPWIIAVAVIVAGLLFGLAVPRLLRSQSTSGWALALGLIGILTLAAYWSGLPIVFGAAALLAGTTARRLARVDGGTARLATAATVLGVLAIAADIIGIIVSTTH